MYSHKAEKTQTENVARTGVYKAIYWGLHIICAFFKYTMIPRLQGVTENERLFTKKSYQILKFNQ